MSLNKKADYVVGIGASAGGLDAIENLFDNMPNDTGAAFVVVQHLSPDFKSLMGEILKRHTKIPIFRVENGMQVQTNSIYLIPPNKTMIITGGKLILTDRDEGQAINLPIDIFFRSLAQEYKSKSIGIILSGSGSDGSRGLKAIKDAGGYTIVQEIATAKFDGMPRAAISSTAVNLVCKTNHMPEVMVEYMNNPQGALVNLANLKENLSPFDFAMSDIFLLLKERHGIDFQYYRSTTIDRRFSRRMEIVKVGNLSSYISYIKENPKELDNLYFDLLIGVTEFFRDPEAFALLEKETFPLIFSKAEQSNLIRVWVPGCATGEEPYSLGIALLEYAKKNGLENIVIKIFATDVHSQSLETASVGIYEEAKLKEISSVIRNRYFNKVEDKWQVSAKLRKLVVFASQNVINDPPFTKIDLLSCRNLLIYFESSLQRKVLSLFHFALRHEGVLFLGPSENLGSLEDEFDVKSSKWKIMVKCRDRRLPDVNPVSFSNDMGKRHLKNVATKTSLVENKNFRDSLINWAYEALLEEQIESGLLIDKHKNLLHVYGFASKFLKLYTGKVSSNLMGLIESEISIPLSAAIHRAMKENKETIYKDISFEDEGKSKTFDITVTPLFSKRSNTRFYFIGFSNPIIKEDEKIIVELSKDIDVSDSRLLELETELRFTKENLQASNEELETSNEELQATNEELVASNEELQSTNEELQSTNEELQSTNEELHSVNEELHTVNTEYQNKIEELSQSNSDMENFLNSTQIGTIFLDKDLRIRRFTPEAGKLMKILDQDIGRPLDHLSHRFNVSALKIELLVKQVLENNKGLEQEVIFELGKKDQRCLLLRILPYIDENEVTQGVVLSFIDINETKLQAKELKIYADKLESSNRDLQDFAYAVSHDLQAPVRHLKWIGDRIKELVNANESVDLSLLKKLDAKCDNIGSLIHNLLEYSRVNTRGADFEAHSCSDVLNSAINNLKIEIKKNNAEIITEPLPTLKIDKGQITRVFQNLIENSIKFRGVNDPKIIISVEHKDGVWQFKVADNGKGMKIEDSEDHDRAFLIFQKLSEDEENLGTGIGLAVTKRIIERHSGKIWLNSVVDKGTEVFFTLPINN